jgi:hypothetical protein
VDEVGELEAQRFKDLSFELFSSKNYALLVISFHG